MEYRKVQFIGPILFNILLCDMFLSADSVDIASYADDNTPCTIGKNKQEVENKIEIEWLKLFKWFHENSMKANQDKCHFLFSLDIKTELLLPKRLVENSSSENLLGESLTSVSMLQICVIKQVSKSKH